jgi:hypothetical protein
MPSDTNKTVTRRTVHAHPRHGERRVLVTVGPGDYLFFRLERERGDGCPLKISDLYDQAERRKACAFAGISEQSIAPCINPLKKRNV